MHDLCVQSSIQLNARPFGSPAVRWVKTQRATPSWRVCGAWGSARHTCRGLTLCARPWVRPEEACLCDGGEWEGEKGMGRNDNELWRAQHCITHPSIPFSPPYLAPSLACLSRAHLSLACLSRAHPSP